MNDISNPRCCNLLTKLIVGGQPNDSQNVPCSHDKRSKETLVLKNVFNIWKKILLFCKNNASTSFSFLANLIKKSRKEKALKYMECDSKLARVSHLHSIFNISCI